MRDLAETARRVWKILKIGAWTVCEGGKACGFAARTTFVDAEARSMKRMADCSEMARAISKRGSGLRAIRQRYVLCMCVVVLWCEPRWGERLLLAKAHLIPGT